MSKRLLRFAPLVLLLLAAGGLYASGVTRSLSLSGLAAHRAAWAAAAQAHPAESLAIFIVAYAAITGAGAPIALALTLTGGLLFGAVAGGLASATAATLAALIGYAAARSALGPWVRAKAEHSPRLAAFIGGLRANAFPLILSARFLPVMPFGLVNLACGFAAVPLRSYVGATVLAALPTSLIYASLGAGLGSSLDAHSLADAAHSPRLWLPLLAAAVLSLAPLAMKALRARQP